MRFPRSTWAPAVAGAALPLTWFVLRDLGGPVEAVAVALPLVVLVLALPLVLLAVLRHERRVLPAVLSLVILGVTTTLGPRLPRTGPPPASPLRLVSANTYAYNPVPAAAVRAILGADADVEIFIETSPELRLLLEEADPDHPYTSLDNQLVVRSRYPIVPMADPPGVPERRILRLTVETPGGPVVLYAVHALNPLSESSLADQLEWVDGLRTAAAQETDPVVLAGDFNMSDRQLGYRRLTSDLRDAVTAAGWGHTTYPDGAWAPLMLRIDHVFVPRDWCAARSRTLHVPGSDHAGLAVDVGPCPGS